MKTSIIVPFFNEASIASTVANEIGKVRDYQDEYIFVNDGSTDETGRILSNISWATCIHLPRNMGQSAAIYAGLQAARGETIVTLDGDGQNDPRDIRQLLEVLDGFDFVIGLRGQRHDSPSRKMASRFANSLRRSILHDGIHDSGCGIKAFRKAVIKAFFPFNGLHRYMPVLAANAGFRVTEYPVNHRPRSGGISKYTNFGRAIRGVHDLIGVKWILRRAVYPEPSPKQAL
jgi:dolichol-phosphate mannosyltransferase